MKKSLLALAVLGAFAGAASAQSSVTLFGVVDVSANNIKNGSISNWSLQSNQLNSNRLGFRGTEDLGGGLSAGFWLEAGMNNETGGLGGSNGSVGQASTGANGASIFNRRSTVSLISSTLGEVRLGRDYIGSFWNLAYFDVYGANGLGQANNFTSNVLGSGAITNARSNSVAQYFLPGNIGGVYGQFAVSPNQGTNGQQYTGGRLGWAGGPVDFAFGFGNTKTAFADDFKTVNFGASYNFGAFKLFGLWNKNTFGTDSLTVWELSTSVPVGVMELRAAYVKADRTGSVNVGAAKGTSTSADDSSSLAAEGIYNLSKRTAVYGGFGRISNKGNAAYAYGSPGNTGSAKGVDSTGYNLGVRHSF